MLSACATTTTSAISAPATTASRPTQPTAYRTPVIRTMVIDALIEPSDTSRVAATIATSSTTAATTASGASTSIAPPPVATPRPPLKPMNTDQT